MTGLCVRSDSVLLKSIVGGRLGVYQRDVGQQCNDVEGGLPSTLIN